MIPGDTTLAIPSRCHHPSTCPPHKQPDLPGGRTRLLTRKDDERPREIVSRQRQRPIENMRATHDDCKEEEVEMISSILSMWNERRSTTEWSRKGSRFHQKTSPLFNKTTKAIFFLIILMGFITVGTARPPEFEKPHKVHSLHKRHHFLLPYTSSSSSQIETKAGDLKMIDGNVLNKISKNRDRLNIEGNHLLQPPDPPASFEEKIDRDARDLEVDSVRTNHDGSIDLTATHRLSKNDKEAGESVEIPSMSASNGYEPMSIKEGHYAYSVANSTNKKAAAYDAFQMLKPEPEVEEIELVKPKKTHSNRLLPTLPSEQRVRGVHKTRKKKPGQLAGRNEALMSAMSAGIHKNPICRTEYFKQRVKRPGCLTKIIVNRFCHGLCSSFYIPRMRPNRLKASFQACAACIPKHYDKMDVTLDCPGMDPPQVTQTVVIVKKCECLAVNAFPEDF